MVYLEIQRRSVSIEECISKLDSENKLYFTKNELKSIFTNFDIKYETKEFEDLYDYLRGSTFTITVNRLIMELKRFAEKDLNKVRSQRK